MADNHDDDARDAYHRSVLDIQSAIDRYYVANNRSAVLADDDTPTVTDDELDRARNAFFDASVLLDAGDITLDEFDVARDHYLALLRRRRG